MRERLRDWQGRLGACVVERMERPFEWGKQDCVLFVADCVVACTGEDPAADFRGEYSTPIEAARIVESKGGMTAIGAQFFGQEVPVMMAQPGDVGVVMSIGRECLAVCTGAVWHAPGEYGLEAVPLGEAMHAWRLLKDNEEEA